MEIHLYTTTGIEEKLDEVKNSLHILDYIIEGMAELHGIDDDAIIAITSVIQRGIKNINQVTRSQKPLALNYDPQTMYYKSTFIPEETLLK